METNWDAIENCKRVFLIDEKIYFLKRFTVNKMFLLLKCGIKNRSYLGLVFSRLYDFWCKNALNLRNEYKKYYKKEFYTFEEYLSGKHNLSKEEIKVLNNRCAYYKDCRHIPESNIQYLLEEESIGNIFAEFLEGGKLSED